MPNENPRGGGAPGGIDLDRFPVDLRTLAYPFWWTLGQARSKCEHIGRAPLSPEKWNELHIIYLIRGVHATTAIEGNTLTEDEVLRIYRDELTLPPSRQYQQQEVMNILGALNKALDLSGFRAQKHWGDLIEDRGGQITFSALGQEAPLELGL